MGFAIAEQGCLYIRTRWQAVWKAVITAGQYPRRAELSSLLALLDEVQNDAMRSAQVCKHVAERCQNIASRERALFVYQNVHFLLCLFVA